MSLAVSSDGGLVISASEDGTARVWDVCTCQALRTYTQHRGPLTNVLLIPSGWLTQAVCGTIITSLFFVPTVPMSEPT